MSARLFYANTRGDICQAFGQWLDGITDWEWYATLTFRDPADPARPDWTRIGWKAAQTALNRFHHDLVMESDANPSWVAVMEMQRRGVPHWHMLVANVPDQRRMDWVDWWWDNFGIARILPYQAELGARYYLGKYLMKGQADIQFSPAVHASLGRRLDKHRTVL